MYQSPAVIATFEAADLLGEAVGSGSCVTAGSPGNSRH